MKSKYLNEQASNFGNEHSLFAVEDVTAAITLTEEDSGKYYTLDAAGGAYVVTLPGPSRVLEGEVDTSDDAPGSSGATGQTSFIIGTQANRGDSFRLVCDGTYWYAQGVSALDGSFTVA